MENFQKASNCNARMDSDTCTMLAVKARDLGSLTLRTNRVMELSLEIVELVVSVVTMGHLEQEESMSFVPRHS